MASEANGLPAGQLQHQIIATTALNCNDWLPLIALFSASFPHPPTTHPLDLCFTDEWSAMITTAPVSRLKAQDTARITRKRRDVQDASAQQPARIVCPFALAIELVIQVIDIGLTRVHITLTVALSDMRLFNGLLHLMSS
jgi:hypothetical protein